ncbi:DMT family transporter [Methanofollis formosanus]|uniref:DMT family transporter n=1 Tax=Methanofollis formosanus TaxID=299308 RepID=A0A8G1A3M5_9EURY|nr:DMT family transporter [Methanofollis formosanus]QYZ79482.1 DMT family transporter [Methanofollis formosanus]
MADPRRLSYLYALIAAFLFGSGAPVAKLFLGDVPPVTLAALFYLGSGIALALYLTTCRALGRDRHGAEAPLGRADLPWLTGVVLFGGFLAPVTLMCSLASTPAATAALLLNFEAVATAAIAALLFAEAVGKRTWAALGLITVSCAILSWEGSGAAGFSVAALGVLLAATFWGMDNNLARNLSARDPLAIVTVKGLCAGTLSLLVATLLAEPLPSPTTCLAAMAVGCISYGGLTSILFILSLRSVGTARTGSIVAIAPFFGVAASFVLYAVPIDPGFYLALPVMALGAWFLVTERHAHPHRHPAGVHEHRHRHDDLHHEGHDHPPGTPPLDARGYHSHPHAHEEVVHDHPHVPDIHHRHRHE